MVTMKSLPRKVLVVFRGINPLPSTGQYADDSLSNKRKAKIIENAWSSFSHTRFYLCGVNASFYSVVQI